MPFFSHIINWFLARDYQNAKDRNTKEVVSRYSRGNVRLQSGRFLTRERLNRLRNEADKALSKLES